MPQFKGGFLNVACARLLGLRIQHDEASNQDGDRGPFLTEPDSLSPEPHDWALALLPPGFVAQHQKAELLLIPR